MQFPEPSISEIRLSGNEHLRIAGQAGTPLFATRYPLP
jgi:hypothetical protein